LRPRVRPHQTSPEVAWALTRFLEPTGTVEASKALLKSAGAPRCRFPP